MLVGVFVSRGTADGVLQPAKRVNKSSQWVDDKGKRFPFILIPSSIYYMPSFGYLIGEVIIHDFE
jgi:hypothetical protein